MRVPENNISGTRGPQAPVVLRAQSQAAESASPPPVRDSYVGSVPRASAGIYRPPQKSSSEAAEKKPAAAPNYTRPVYNHRENAVSTVQSSGTCCPCCNK